MTELENLYGVLGGRFITPASEMQHKLQQIKAFVFDWDGVFNNGEKQAGGSSNFSEVDSMGTNLLRFSHYLKQGALPLTGIISGEKNSSAFYFSERECLHYSFSKIPHKQLALDFLCAKENIQPEQVAYFFDDVLDLPIARHCGLRLMVNQKANPLFSNYCVKHKLVDYLSACAGGSFAVREMTELLIGLNGNYDAVIAARTENSPEYQAYIQQRKEVKPDFYTLAEGGIIQAVSPSD